MKMISIIVPIFNAEKYISRCVNSVLRQTYHDWELLLINDGSTDQSEKICLNYSKSDTRIRYFSKINEGPGPTRAFGVGKAKGDFIYFIDSDDYISDNALETLLSHFSDEVDCVIGQHRRFGQVPDIKQVKFEVDNFDLQKNEKSDFIKLLLNRGHHGGMELWNKLFRRSVVFNVCSVPIYLKYGEDILLTVSIFLRCREIVFIHDCTYYYEYKQNSLARNTANNKELQVFANELIRLEEHICKSKTDLNVYPLIVYIMLKIPISRYKSDSYELLKQDIYFLSKTERIVYYAKRFLKTRRNLKRKYKINYSDYCLATCIYKSILKNNVWYFTKLYPACLEKRKKCYKCYIIKAYIKRILNK